MIDTLSYYKEIGDRAVQTLITLGCKQCKICKRWMDKEFILENEICDECSKKETRL